MGLPEPGLPDGVRRTAIGVGNAVAGALPASYGMSTRRVRRVWGAITPSRSITS